MNIKLSNGWYLWNFGMTRKQFKKWVKQDTTREITKGKVWKLK